MIEKMRRNPADVAGRAAEREGGNRRQMSTATQMGGALFTLLSPASDTHIHGNISLCNAITGLAKICQP